MQQPLGFIDPTRPTHVYRLKKIIYGLWQAPCAWFQRFSNFLHDGFYKSLVDSSIFVFHSPSSTIIIILYVDDIILTDDNS